MHRDAILRQEDGGPREGRPVAVRNGPGGFPHLGVGLGVHVDADGVGGAEGGGEELLQNADLFKHVRALLRTGISRGRSTVELGWSALGWLIGNLGSIS